MEHHMGDDTIDNNVGRLRNFLFHILGCSNWDANEIIRRFIEKYLKTGSSAKE
jgi:hypothetical protein